MLPLSTDTAILAIIALVSTKSLWGESVFGDSFETVGLAVVGGLFALGLVQVVCRIIKFGHILRKRLPRKWDGYPRFFGLTPTGMRSLTNDKLVLKIHAIYFREHMIETSMYLCTMVIVIGGMFFLEGRFG